MKKLLSFVAMFVLSLSSTHIFAAAPVADVSGDVNVEVSYANILNAGMALGGDAELELSIASVHGDSTVGGDFNVTVGPDASSDGLTVLGGALLTAKGNIVNAGLVVGGDLCVKTAIGSIGASTCTYGADAGSGSDGL